MESKITLLMSIALGVVALSNATLKSGIQDEGSTNATKRGAISFGLMVLRVTRRNPLDFIGYGCWCGLGGKGKPVDDLDRCCLAHDRCYGKVQQSRHCPFRKGVYVLPYSTERNQPSKCKPASYYWFWGKCRHLLCKCDAEAAECFKRSPYQKKYKRYPQSKCKNDKS